VDPAGVTDEVRSALDAALQEQGLQVRWVLLTHHHRDHIGGATHLQAHGATLLSHPRTATLVAERWSVQVDALLQDGDLLHPSIPWRVLHTPGHAPGHLCAHHDETVVAGDLVAGEGTIVLDSNDEADLQAYLDSLQRIARLGPKRLLPAHGPVIEPALPLLQHYQDHRNARTAQIEEALQRKQPATALDLVPGIYPELPTVFHAVAAAQVTTHLGWLEARGRARVSETLQWRIP
jgi:glyoxylase-like metal-dependent hydrolase (beta-lactamase superfamily II)